MVKGIVKLNKNLVKVLNLPGWTPVYDTIYVHVDRETLCVELTKYDAKNKLAYFSERENNEIAFNKPKF